MDSVWSLLDQKRREGKRILFEGAQGALLDIDHGTYPFVTSSNTVAAQAATGSGLGPAAIGYVLGICKAYTTRVGEGPFPTEQKNEIGRLIGERGREFGTVTGRPRRCGWFDAVLVRQTVRTSGINGLALTKLDILDGLTELKVCVAYRLDGREIDYLPASEHAQARGRAGLRDGRGLAGRDRAGALVGGTAGAGDQICAPHRGIGRVPGRLAVDQPGARGHHSDAESVRELNSGEFRSAERVSSSPMADYYPLISRAVAGLEKNNGENRRALYERARAALLAQLRGVTPALNESDITRERLALEEAIRKVEAESARQFVEPSRQPPAPKIRPIEPRPVRSRARRSRAQSATTTSRRRRRRAATSIRRPPRRRRGGRTRPAECGRRAAAAAGRAPVRHDLRPAAVIRAAAVAGAGAAAAPSAAPPRRRAPLAVRCRPQGFPQRRLRGRRARRRVGAGGAIGA